MSTFLLSYFSTFTARNVSTKKEFLLNNVYFSCVRALFSLKIRNFVAKLNVIMYGIDIKEDELLALGGGILETLLIDRTTGENIIWATNDYSSLGDSYTFFKHITPELITGDKKNVIQPRVAKNEEERKKRARKMAEVFTPSWVCNGITTLRR